MFMSGRVYIKMFKMGEILIPREEIRDMVDGLAARINEDYCGKEILLVGVLKGAMIFLADI